MCEMKAYITNLGKYNEGCLVGKWIDFPIDDDDFESELESIVDSKQVSKELYTLVITIFEDNEWRF